MKNKIYIAKYSTGSYENHKEYIVFASTNKSKVTKWCTKFNKMLKKWIIHYDKYCHDYLGIRWIKEEYVEKHYERWSLLQNINNAYYEEIEIR